MSDPGLSKRSIEVRAKSVIKRFSNPEDFEREYAVYKLELSMTPRLLGWQEPLWLELERIGGQPYLDLPLDVKAVTSLAQTLARFHRATWKNSACLCHWDNQPRNILKREDTFFFIDFSESRRARPADDITHLLLFWASEFTGSQLERLARAFSEEYRRHISLDRITWLDASKESITRFDERRAQYGHPEPHASEKVCLGNRLFLRTLLD